MTASPSPNSERAAARAAVAPLAWAVWGLAALFFCYGFFHRLAPSVMIDHLMRDLAISGAVLGNLSAFYFYAYAGLQIPVGLLHDRWGPRRMLTLGALLCALGSFVFATAGALPWLYLGRLMIGAGAAFSFVGALKLAAAWFPANRFAQLTGMTMMLGMLGGIFGQAPVAALVESIGWRDTLLGAAGAGLLLAAAIWIVVRDQPAAPSRLQSQSGGDSIPALRALLHVLRYWRNWALALTAAAMASPLLAFAGFWGVAWLMQVHGLPRPEAAGTASLLLVGWAIGSPLAGGLSDRLGRRKPLLMLGCLLGLAALAAILYLPLSPGWPMMILFFVTGFSCGAMVVGFALVREDNPNAVSGVAIAFINMATVSSGALFQPLIGWLLDRQWDGRVFAGARLYSADAYRHAFSVLLVFLLVGLLCSFLARETRGNVHGP